MVSLDDLRRLLETKDNLADDGPLPHPAQTWRHLTWDSRDVRPDSLFVAKTGRIRDGHRFIPDAVAAGASAVVGSESAAHYRARCREAGMKPPPYIQVRNCERAYAQAAALFYGFPARSLITAGVTGTDGKTTSIGLLTSILSQAPSMDDPDVPAAGSISTLGVMRQGVLRDSGFHVTTPDAREVQKALRDMEVAGCRYVALECTSHGLAQHRVDETEMNVVGLTRVTHEHLDYHETFERYLAAKSAIVDLLADVCDPGPAVVLDADDERACRVVRERVAGLDRAQAIAVHAYTRSPDRRADSSLFRALDMDLNRRGLTMRVREPEGAAWPVASPLLGDFNASNVLLAIAMARVLNFAPDRIARGVRRFRGVEGRMQRIDAGQDFEAIVDFAHSPGSLEAALSTLRAMLRGSDSDQGGRIIAVFGCAGLRDQAKRGLMGAVSARWADHIVVTAEDPRTESLPAICQSIVDGIRSASHPVTVTWEIEHDRARAMERAVAAARPGDVVVAFGKGHERSMCFGETEYDWSDQAALTHALRRRLSQSVDPNHYVYRLPTGQG